VRAIKPTTLEDGGLCIPRPVLFPRTVPLVEAHSSHKPSVNRNLANGYTVAVSKTFYIETFGCQMNAHDSEKVIGTLEQQGYARVQDEDAAGLILYNTCSIRDKAEQKVFHRLNE
jgi:hypothetical protein